MPFSVWTRQGEKAVRTDSWEANIDETAGTIAFPKTPTPGSETIVITIKHLLGYRTDGLVENRRIELLNGKGQTFFVGAYSSKIPETVVSIGGVPFYEFAGTSGERLSLFARDGTVAIGNPKTAAP